MVVKLGLSHTEREEHRELRRELGLSHTEREEHRELRREYLDLR
jgi:uncharacterized protein YnzC (UPF0291/DUF896 family)